MTLVESFALSDVADRDGNEDAFVRDDANGVFAVADGIGGQPGGAQASRAAVAAFQRLVGSLAPARRADPEALREVTAAVNREVMALGEAEQELKGLGTTLSAVVLGPGRQERLVHLGDSRVYRFRDGALARLTREHTVAGELVALGRLTPEEARRHPLRGTLSRFLGSAADSVPDVEDLSVREGDWLLLVTDGLTAVVDDGVIGSVLGRGQGPEDVCRSLVEEALRLGPPDNVTVVAVHVARDGAQGA